MPKSGPVKSRIGLHEWPAGGGGRLAATLAAAALLGVALLVIPFAPLPLWTSFPLLGMLVAASIVGTAITALLLLIQGRTLGSTAMTVLGTGFAVASLMMVPYAAFYPGMFGSFEAGLAGRHGTSTVLWLGWHAELAVAIVLYVYLRRFPNDHPQAQQIGRVAVAGLALGAIGLVTFAIQAHLPPIFANGTWTSPYVVIGLPAVALPGLAAIAIALLRRSPTVLDLACGLVALAIMLELFLTLIGQHPFSVAWYTSRLEMMATIGTVLGILMVQTARLYADLVQRAEVLEGEAHTDTLTGLANRRRFDEELARATGSAMRRSSSVSVAMIDIDRFKLYNDTFGHQAGDVALQRIARVIGDSVARSNDFAARYGGEEFIVILEDTDLDGAIAVAERIRTEVLAAALPAPRGGLLSVSIGVAVRRPGETGEALVRRADEALYSAKNSGRNRVVASDPADISARAG